MSHHATPIEMLPDLEDLEGNGGMNQNMYGNPMNSGGSGYAQNMQIGQQNMQNMHQAPGMNMIPPEETERMRKFIRGGHVPPAEAGMTPINQVMQEPVQSGVMEHYVEPEPQNNTNLTTYNMPHNSPSCLEVAEHVANCPICSKFYNNDKTIYIVAIVALSVICILLLKRVLEA